MNVNIEEHEENADIPDRLVDALQDNEDTHRISIKFWSISTAQRVDLIIDFLAKYNLFPKLVKDEKDNVESSEIRKKGNQLFCSEKDESALEMFTYSVAVAESGSEDLGLAYANRSAVFFKLKLFKECLQDIQRALQTKYPDHLEQKLIERQRIAEKLKMTQVKFQHHQTIPTIPNDCKNTFIECASDSVEIKYDKKYGRHIVAAKDIRVGEVIAIEKPAFTLLTNKKWCHCHHCLSICYNLIPCKFCTQVLFCSEECVENSKTYHEIECQILKTIHTLGFDPRRVLPLRIAVLMRNKYDNLKEIIKETDEVYRSSRYKEIHNLVTHYQHLIGANAFERVTATALFFHLVKTHTNFFKDAEQNVEDTFKTLVLRHLQIMTYNFQSIYELEKNSMGAYLPVTLGSGAYSFLSLFNHACSPNITGTLYGTTMVLTAIETIPEGYQLFDDYGYHYAMKDKQTRQAELKKQYFFDCNCLACQENWGTLSTLPKLNSKFYDILTKNYSQLANADVKTAKRMLPLVYEAVEQLEEESPSKDFCEVQENLKHILDIMGNTRKSLQYK